MKLRLDNLDLGPSCHTLGMLSLSEDGSILIETGTKSSDKFLHLDSEIVKLIVETYIYNKENS